MKSTPLLTAIPDDELLHRLADLLKSSRHTEADLVAHIGEVDARRLYAREASPSMWAYCTERLHLSGAEAYLRIAAARASREHPVILDMLADGRLHLTAVALLAPHLTPENRDGLLRRATHKSKREIEELVAVLQPRPDVPASIRKLPDRGASVEMVSALLTEASHAPSALPISMPSPATIVTSSRDCPAAAALSTVASRLDGRCAGLTPAGTGRDEYAEPPSSRQLRRDEVVSKALDGLARGVAPCPRREQEPPARQASIEPLSPARYKVQFTASAELREKLGRLQALMRSSIPDGNLGAVIEAAVTEKLERLEHRRFGRTEAPRKALEDTDVSPRSRHVPAAVRRAVHERDQGRCRYVDEQGRRCTERLVVQLHHRRTFAMGGHHSPENLSLLCPAHNRHMAEIDYGREAMARHGCGPAPAKAP